MTASTSHALALPDCTIVPNDALEKLHALVETMLDAVDHGNFAAGISTSPEALAVTARALDEALRTVGALQIAVFNAIQNQAFFAFLLEEISKLDQGTAVAVASRVNQLVSGWHGSQPAATVN